MKIKCPDCLSGDIKDISDLDHELYSCNKCKQHFHGAEAIKETDHVVNYELSLNKTKNTFAKHFVRTSDPNVTVRIYLPYLMEVIQEEIKNKYVHLSMFPKLFEETCQECMFKNIVFLTLLERFCAECRMNNTILKERGLPKKRIMGRCEEYKNHPCKLHYITDKVYEILKEFEKNGK